MGLAPSGNGENPEKNGGREDACSTFSQEYTAALDISERLAQLDPTNATWRDDVVELRERLDAISGS